VLLLARGGGPAPRGGKPGTAARTETSGLRSCIEPVREDGVAVEGVAADKAATSRAIVEGTAAAKGELSNQGGPDAAGPAVEGTAANSDRIAGAVEIPSMKSLPPSSLPPQLRMSCLLANKAARWCPTEGCPT